MLPASFNLGANCHAGRFGTLRATSPEWEEFMKRLLLLLIGFALSSSLFAQTTTYTLVTTTSGTLDFVSPCPGGPCVNYAPGMRVAGQFTTANPLPRNLPSTDLLPLVTSFTLVDGLNTYRNTDPDVRVNDFTAGTDASGNIVPGAIDVQLWQTGSSPHVSGDRFAQWDILGATNTGANNDVCTSVGTSPVGVADTCLSHDPDTGTSLEGGPGTWSFFISAAAVPALTSWPLAVLALLALGIGLRHVRTRPH